MSVLVTGSVAIDHIMAFEDSFGKHVLPDQLHRLNVAFLVPSLEKRWGGTGANIAYNRIHRERTLISQTLNSITVTVGSRT